MIHESNPDAQRAYCAMEFWKGQGGDGYTCRNIATQQRLQGPARPVV
jgi:hypothetical protein